MSKSVLDNPSHNIYLKMAKKTRINKINHFHCSRTLLEQSAVDDTLYSARLGINFLNFLHGDTSKENYLLKASTEACSNFTEISYLRHKFFFRYIVPYQSALIQASLSGAILTNRSNVTRINDNLYIKNFKGIRNIGYFYDSTSTKAIAGENLGFDKYLNASLKISQLDMPLLNYLNGRPFIHANLALAPNRNF